MIKALLFSLCTAIGFSATVCAQISDFQTTDFRKADSIAALYPKHSLSDLRDLAQKLTEPLNTEEEKFRSLYKWICNNIENDYQLYLTTTRERAKIKSPEEFKAWNKTFTQKVFKILIEKQKTVCSGYAYLLKEMALHAGLTCVIINGYGRTAQANIGGPGIPNHSWNAVQFNNKWYLCDATWSSGAIDILQSKFIRKFNEAYFLADPLLFVRNHFPMDSAWLLLDTKPTLKEFLNGPLIYSAIYDFGISKVFPETFEITTGKNDTVNFRFNNNSNKIIEKVQLQIKGPNKMDSVEPQLYQDSTGLYCVDHVFKTKGTHTVHILVNGSFAFTYNVSCR